MSAELIPFPASSSVTFDPVRVEISRLKTHDGRVMFFVDYIERDGGRSGMWDGDSYTEAVDAATDCARTEGAPLPIVDRVVAEALDAPTAVKIDMVEEARLTFDDETAAELSDVLGLTPENTTKH